MKEDWFWAAHHGAGTIMVPAGDAFIIENGQEALWARVRAEFPNDSPAWNSVHRGHDKPRLEDILNLILVPVSIYRVNRNKFMFEAAKIPVFARFLRHSSNCDLCNYVSNWLCPDTAIKPELYSDEAMRKLGRIVNETLGIDDDWF